ncbi:hypothetical protein SAMN04489722_103445 [Algibacter lectus]|uniref:hypothetical protein n=1 Tax=Algibacter lectus TaxID=221126 RepID=UPI0008DEC4D0|nr:hypothetical protein [Algibacter lectus]SFC79266.1 hypothetical protein SAMN04489722_103445 [Algibacter lectus]
MNKFEALHTEYLRPSRTIETVLVTNECLSEIFFIYNYEGISFRVFKSHLDLINFFLNKSESSFHFNTEDELDIFLSEEKLVA